jgi:hypothetical protein
MADENTIARIAAGRTDLVFAYVSTGLRRKRKIQTESRSSNGVHIMVTSVRSAFCFCMESRCIRLAII